MAENLIEVKNLQKYFSTAHGMLHAVDNINLTIEKGKTLGVVGESGCGKSTLGRTLIHLLESTGGNIYFKGEDVTHLNRKRLKALREEMQIIFQDPYSSIDPRKTIRETVMEPMKISRKMSKKEINDATDALVELVGIDQRLANAYPHELDGGRRQRVGIARALALNPKFIVCDEPVSALDVSIQAQVLNLLKKLQREKEFTYMFVTHDLSVVKHISDDICVMYLGQVVEKSPTKELFEKPIHPYTQALLSAIPEVDVHKTKEIEILKGEITSPIDPKPGCRFAARCKYAAKQCQESQVLEAISEGHFVSCCRARELSFK
ncbi:ABC transporter ATP-binding protein [Ruminococcus gauvreauii]|uniref:ATP-binding cassette domain-containing protein n=1 Tax=Ruminococcus gauvreauii TaxID=438033 RepID=A0ABY5VCH9_9FIRM|nr:oligopeptide/dipeptide ABC transporter ATP-binding protein [Ruminococcus gauvreauii]UWP58231.1 ATP-binding cassette domain-containing protein [Ruminococcus gauvreauii]